MSEENKQPETEDEGKPTVWVSFCRDLGIYHIHREVDDEDPTDTKFTRAELLDLVDGLLKSGQAAEAGQLATLCAWGRLFNHKVVVFYTSGMFRVFNPLPPDEGEEEESEDMKKFFEDWQRNHPKPADLPTVVAYATTPKRQG